MSFHSFASVVGQMNKIVEGCFGVQITQVVCSEVLAKSLVVNEQRSVCRENRLSNQS